MQVKAVNDWILVEMIKDEPKEQVKNGIVIPVQVRKKEKEEISIKSAKVIQISERVPWFAEQDETTIGYDVGDIIYFYGKTGISYEEDGRKYHFLKWNNIVAIGTADKEEQENDAG